MPTAPEPATWAVRVLDIQAGSAQAYLHPQDADALGLHPLDRVRVREAGGPELTASVVVSAGLAQPGTVGLSSELHALLRAEQAVARVHLEAAPRPRSVQAIRRKLDGQRLASTDIGLVVHDIAYGNLGLVETAAWACAVQAHGMDAGETVACIQAMVDTGQRIRFTGGPIVDVHSIGGVPGNKYAPITVAIAAANGLRIPKTSSRAISSACGTADLMEVIAPVALTAAQVQAITESVGGTLAWGGAVNLAPADDAVVRVEYPLQLDPPSQMVASVLAKKVAVGASSVLIDLPVGPAAKLRSEEAARRLAHDFISIGAQVGLDVHCVVTRGSQPLGRAIGPALEAREALEVLEGAAEPDDVIEKACTLAGRLLEMGKVVPPGQGPRLAQRTLASGQALAKFRQIVAAQGGNPAIASKDVAVGAFTGPHEAAASGTVARIDNAALVQVARAAGAPHDRGAGLLVLARPGMPAEEGRPLMLIHAEQPRRLEEALLLARQLQPFAIEGREVLGFVE